MGTEMACKMGTLVRYADEVKRAAEAGDQTSAEYALAKYEGEKAICVKCDYADQEILAACAKTVGRPEPKAPLTYCWRIRAEPSHSEKKPRIAHLLVVAGGTVHSRCRVGPKGYPAAEYRYADSIDKRCKVCLKLEMEDRT